MFIWVEKKGICLSSLKSDLVGFVLFVINSAGREHESISLCVLIISEDWALLPRMAANLRESLIVPRIRDTRQTIKFEQINVSMISKTFYILIEINHTRKLFETCLYL